jgi:hypothetical protein
MFTGVVMQRWEALVTSPLAGVFTERCVLVEGVGVCDVTSQVHRVHAAPYLLLRHPCHNMVLSIKGLGPEKDRVGKDQQHIQKRDPSSC